MIKIHDTDVKMMPVDGLVPYEHNAKMHTDEQIDHIVRSIQEFGFNDNVGVWTAPDGSVQIVTGHGAVMAAKRLGMTEVPCDFLDHLTDEERREYCHVHNQTQLETGFDPDLLSSEMEDIDCDWGAFGFEVTDPGESAATEVDIPSEDEVEPRAKRGDVWTLGRHRLMCGDSTDASDMHSLCPGGGARAYAH